MYQCSKKLATCKEHCCFDHSDFLAHSMFTSDVCWGSLGTSIFGNSSSAANNTRSRLPSRLSFRFFWLWSHKPLQVAAAKTFFWSVFIVECNLLWLTFLFHLITGNSIFYSLSLLRGLVQLSYRSALCCSTIILKGS